MFLNSVFPFTAIIGQEDFKLCLLLNLIDSSIGGVLATGDKGTGKTTTARALAALVPEAKFVNLPIGATEDRVLGSIALEPLLKEQKTVVDKGLLAKAHRGILYVDEVNLLSDDLVDLLLDAAAFKGYALEREGISLWQESAFCLVGTMNPEEGNLRPQLEDRFGLSTHITTPNDLQTRMQISEQRLAFEAGDADFVSRHQQAEKHLKERIARAKNKLTSIVISKHILAQVAKLCMQANVAGLRADLTLLKALRAYAAYSDTTDITDEMITKIAPFVLNHRKKEGGMPPKKIPENGAQALQNEGGGGFKNEDFSNIDTNQKEQAQNDHVLEIAPLPDAIKKNLRFEVKKKS